MAMPMRRHEEKKQTILELNLLRSAWANGSLPHGFAAMSSFSFLFLLAITNYISGKMAERIFLFLDEHMQ